MNYLITLVHGTFATNAPWTQQNSQFCANLVKELDGQVTFLSFHWSGKNNNNSRIEASRDLLEELKRQQKEFPDYTKIIIAHSHGGNIAMYALRDLQDNNSYKLVTMATPYLNTEVRKFERSLNVHALHISAAVSALFILVMTLAPRYILKLMPWLAIIKWYFLVILFGLLAWVWVDLAQRLEKWVLNKLLKKCKIIDASARLRGKELILTSPETQFEVLALIDYSDEIKLWFRFLYRLWEPLFSLYDFFIRHIRVVVFILLTVTFIKVYIIDDQWGKVPGLASLVLVSNYGFAYLALPMVTLILIVLLNFLKSNFIVLGRESYIEQLLIKTIPSNTPLGYRKLNFIQHNLGRKSLGVFKHSVYEHQVVTEDIADWVKSSNNSSMDK